VVVVVVWQYVDRVWWVIARNVALFRLGWPQVGARRIDTRACNALGSSSSTGGGDTVTPRPAAWFGLCSSWPKPKLRGAGSGRNSRDRPWAAGHQL